MQQAITVCVCYNGLFTKIIPCDEESKPYLDVYTCAHSLSMYSVCVWTQSHKDTPTHTHTHTHTHVRNIVYS